MDRNNPEPITNTHDVVDLLTDATGETHTDVSMPIVTPIHKYYWPAVGLPLLGLWGCQPNAPTSSGSAATSEQVSAKTYANRAMTSISMSQAARFLQQAQFSSNLSDIQRVQNLGYDGWLNEQLALPTTTTVKGWIWLQQQGYAADTYKYDNRPMDHMMWHQLVTCQDTVRKRVALALSEILVVSIEGMTGEYPSFAMAAYWDLLNQYAFGNFRFLLQALTLNPAMGRFLNTKGNKKEDRKTNRRPDENYARELLQLFSIGLYELNIDGSVQTNTRGKPIETYDLQQIVELARVFTGWDEDHSTSKVGWPDFTRQPMKLNPQQHSTWASQIFNQTIPAGTAGDVALSTAIHTISLHKNVAPFISKQLIQRLVMSNPSPAYVARVAQVFNNNGTGVRGDLKAVVRAILLDQEARQDPSMSQYSGKVREPMLRLVQWCRTFNVRSVSGRWLVGNLSSPEWFLSQSPLRAPSVFNFFKPSFSPTNSPLNVHAKVAPELQICDESSVAAYINFMKGVIENGVSRYDDWRVAELIPNYSVELSLVEQPADLVNRLNRFLCAGQMTVDTRTLITNALISIKPLSSTSWRKNRVYCAILFVMASPDYQVQK